MSKPTQFPDWATNGSNIATVPAGKVTVGWLTAERPPAQWFNYWQHLVGLWTRWLNSETDAIRTELELIRSNLSALDKLAALNVQPRTAAAGFNSDWAAVAFGLPNNDRIWIIVGGTDTIQYSRDEGRTWAVATGTTGAGQFKGAAYGNGVFIAVGASDSSGSATAIIYSSLTGTAWTARTPGGSPPAGHTLTSVTFTANKFIAVGPHGHIQTSPDGITWTKQAAPVATDNLSAIASRTNLIVAVGQNAGTAVAIYSPDGITWLRFAFPATVRSLWTIAANATHFIAGGNLNADSATSVVYSSTDGATWTEQTTFLKTLVMGVASIGSVFVFCTDSSQNPTLGSSAALIAGGISIPWTVAPIRRETLWAVGSNDNKIITVGSQGYIADSLIRVSTGGGGSSGGGGDGSDIEGGAGLTKSGSTLDVVAADDSIIVYADSIRVGVLQTDDMHGTRGGGEQHAAATTTAAGFMTAADKSALETVATQIKTERFPVALRIMTLAEPDYVEIGVIRFNAAPFAGLMRLNAELETTVPTQMAELRFYNLTTGTPIITLNTSSNITTEVSADLTLPVVETLYSIQIRRIGGDTSQPVSCRSVFLEPR